MCISLTHRSLGEVDQAVAAMDRAHMECLFCNCGFTLSHVSAGLDNESLFKRGAFLQTILRSDAGAVRDLIQSNERHVRVLGMQRAA